MSSLEASMALKLENAFGSAASADSTNMSSEPARCRPAASAVEAPAAAMPRMKFRRVPVRRPLNAASCASVGTEVGSMGAKLARGGQGVRQLGQQPHTEPAPTGARVRLAGVPGHPDDVE